MGDPDPHADPSHARIAAILRDAVALPDDAALDDETRRIMLHLSVEPVAPVARRSGEVQAEVSHATIAQRASGLRRWMKRRRANKA